MARIGVPDELGEEEEKAHAEKDEGCPLIVRSADETRLEEVSSKWWRTLLHKVLSRLGSIRNGNWNSHVQISHSRKTRRTFIRWEIVGSLQPTDTMSVSLMLTRELR